MASAVPFDRETLLDLTVNAIPLGIMLFFIALFVLINPFGSDPVGTAIQLTIVGVTFLALFILTWVSGKAIAEAEAEMERKGLTDGTEEIAGELEAETATDADGDADSDAEESDADAPEARA